MANSRILMGVIGRPHGVRGLVRVTSYTEDPAALARYFPLFDEQGRSWRLAWHAEIRDTTGIAELTDAAGVRVADRAGAEKLTNIGLYVEREALPPPAEDEFYLADLIGMRVRIAGGAAVGEVRQVHDYGAGSSLEIETADGTMEMIPFTRHAVPVVDLVARVIEVVPPDEFIVNQDLGGGP